jgi:hypothetical protein
VKRLIMDESLNVFLTVVIALYMRMRPPKIASIQD